MSVEMFRRTYAEIDLDAMVSNWFEIKKVAADDRFICPMVKANAYGHGDVQVALTLEKLGANIVGVCLIEEGLLLRSSGYKSDILVFRGFDKLGAEKILEYQMTPVVSTWEQIAALEAVADEPVKVHLKFNTGMNRLGFNFDQAEKLAAYFKQSKKLKLKALLSHFALGEDAYLVDGFSFQQTKTFENIFDQFHGHDIYGHLLSSGGIASLARVRSQNLKEHYLNKRPWGFRPGLMLYGYQPASQFHEVSLKPVMTLKSVVNNVRDVAVGEGVSYGSTWRASRPSKIAVVPIGYADGVHRIISNQAQALLAGQLVNIVGRICMDFLMLDVTDLVQTQGQKKWIEEEVILFGFDEKNQFHSAEKIAEKSSTIVWETLTSVGERVPRHYRGLTNPERGIRS